MREGRDPLGDELFALRSPAQRRYAGACYTPPFATGYRTDVLDIDEDAKRTEGPSLSGSADVRG